VPITARPSESSVPPRITWSRASPDPPSKEYTGRLSSESVGVEAPAIWMIWIPALSLGAGPL
jgi:hypothetical protein